MAPGIYQIIIKVISYDLRTMEVSICPSIHAFIIWWYYAILISRNHAFLFFLSKTRS